jgi:hypothetical protein
VPYLNCDANSSKYPEKNVMSCPEISALTFSPSGAKAIEEIRRIQSLGKTLAVLMGGSVLVSIFVGRTGVQGPFESAWNISQTEWGAWSQAMVSIPAVTRNRIRNIAAMEALGSSSGQEREFWTAVADGCGY